jgi:hypothetical protein
MRTYTHVHGIKLNEPDLTHHAPEVTNVDAAAVLPRCCESLCTKCDPTRSISRNRFHVFTIIVAPTLSE